MSTFEKHCEESIRLFGKPYGEVHNWLDEFQGTPEYKMRHRRKRHHEAGIRQATEPYSAKKPGRWLANMSFRT